MQYVSSTEIRNNFSRTIDMAQREPVVVQKQGRDVAVVLSPQDYARITRSNADDLIEFMKETSRKAKARGLTRAKLKKLLEEDD